MGEMRCISNRHWSSFHLTFNMVFVLHSLLSQHPRLQLVIQHANAENWYCASPRPCLVSVPNSANWTAFHHTKNVNLCDGVHCLISQSPLQERIPEPLVCSCHIHNTHYRRDPSVSRCGYQPHSIGPSCHRLGRKGVCNADF